MYNIRELTVENFIEKIAEPTFPGPASGSAVATGAAAACALVEMSCLASLRRGQVPILQEILPEIKDLREELLNLSVEDMKKVGDLINNKNVDSKTKEKLVKDATKPLIYISKKSLKVLYIIEKVALKCIYQVKADLIGGVHLSYAAVNASCAGALANLNLIGDKEYIEEVEEMIREILDICNKKKESLLNTINNKQGGLK